MSISGRMSILSGSMGMEYNVEDLLKNIDIHGTKLSSIRLEKYSNFIKKSKISELKTKRSLGLPLLDKN